jgi:hypothetical protein
VTIIIEPGEDNRIIRLSAEDQARLCRRHPQPARTDTGATTRRCPLSRDHAEFRLMAKAKGAVSRSPGYLTKGIPLVGFAHGNSRDGDDRRGYSGPAVSTQHSGHAGTVIICSVVPWCRNGFYGKQRTALRSTARESRRMRTFLVLVHVPNHMGDHGQ